jgi:hypothetical protein
VRIRPPRLRPLRVNFLFPSVVSGTGLRDESQCLKSGMHHLTIHVNNAENKSILSTIEYYLLTRPVSLAKPWQIPPSRSA